MSTGAAATTDHAFAATRPVLRLVDSAPRPLVGREREVAAIERLLSAVENGRDRLAEFECQLDDAGFAACAMPYTAPALSAGAHTFAARAVDDLGNPDPTPAERAFTIGSGPSGTLPLPPVNLQGPRIIPVHPKPFYACDPGQWEHAVTLSYRWLQWHVKSTGDPFAPATGWDVVATTQVYLPDPSVLPYVCEVTATNAAGATTTAYSDAVTIAPSAPPVKTPWGSIFDAIPIAHP
jgi:hypothetical protein